MAILPLQNQVKSECTNLYDIVCLLILSSIRLKVTFVDKEGDEHTFEVAKGDNLLDIAQANDLEMEGIPTAYSTMLQLLNSFKAHAEDLAHVLPVMLSLSRKICMTKWMNRMMTRMTCWIWLLD